MTMVKTSTGIDLNATPIDDTPVNLGDDTAAELHRMRLENNKLREMLTLVWEGNFVINQNKRKLKESDHDQCNTSESTERIKRVCRPDDSSYNTMVVKDGYKWRKYGQKATKDNPFPRAYYKCSFPSCPAKKKVQGSVDDANSPVVVYEGEHNHHKRMGNEEEADLNSKFDQVLVEKVANSLRTNPDFIQELVEAISSKNFEYDSPVLQ